MAVYKGNISREPLVFGLYVYIYTRVSCGMFAFKTIWFCPSMGKNIVMFFFWGGSFILNMF